MMPLRHRQGWRCSFTLSLTSALDWGWMVNATPWPLFPWERDPVLILQESGWAPGPVWTGAESVAPHWRKVCGSSDESTKQIERTADICLVIHFFLGIPSLFRRLRRQTVVDGNWQACWQCALHVLLVQTPGALHSRTPLV